MKQSKVKIETVSREIAASNALDLSHPLLHCAPAMLRSHLGHNHVIHISRPQGWGVIQSRKIACRNGKLVGYRLSLAAMGDGTAREKESIATSGAKIAQVVGVGGVDETHWVKRSGGLISLSKKNDSPESLRISFSYIAEGRKLPESLS